MLLPANKLPPEISRAVVAIETIDGKLTKLRFADRSKSLEMLSQHLGMDRRELQIAGDEGPVLRVVIRSVLDQPPEKETTSSPSAARKQLGPAARAVVDLLPGLGESEPLN